MGIFAIFLIFSPFFAGLPRNLYVDQRFRNGDGSYDF